MHQSKIEQAQEKVEQLREELRSQVEEEVRSSLRKRTWRTFLLRGFGCCGLYVAALISVPVLLAYLIARTGLVEVPVLSARVASERTATRTVTAQTVDASRLLTEKFRTLLARGALPDAATITLTEQELTGLLRAMVASDPRVPAITRDTAQVVVTANGAEIFARMSGYGGRETTVLLRGVPEVKDGKLAVAFTTVAIGNLGIPRVAADALTRSFLSQLPPLRFGGDGPLPSFTVDRISLADGAAHLSFRQQP